MLLRKYSQNINAVDPQLKNNKELVELIEIYESSWTLGKDQLLNKQVKDQLIKFCLNMERLGHKYAQFKEQIECFEADIFLSIPSLLVLRSIQNAKDSHEHKQLCLRFCPDFEFSNLTALFNKMQGDREKMCSELEQFIIHDDTKYLSNSAQKDLGQQIKVLGMQLSRSDAQ